MCAPYFVNLDNSIFQLKRYYSLFIYVHTSQQKRTEKVISSYQTYSVANSTLLFLRVAIISNVQNVRLQRRQRPTDDASTRRWRGSQQTGPANYDTFIMSLATLSLSNK